jgi:hypothetical protein
MCSCKSEIGQKQFDVQKVRRDNTSKRSIVLSIDTNKVNDENATTTTATTSSSEGVILLEKKLK